MVVGLGPVDELMLCQTWKFSGIFHIIQDPDSFEQSLSQFLIFAFLGSGLLSGIVTFIYKKVLYIRN